MAIIAATTLGGPGSRAVTLTTLGASDTFTYTPGAVLYLDNVTGGALTPNLVGADADTVGVPGVGSIDVSGGYDCPSISAGATAVIPLDSIAQYLAGGVTVTGGDGIEAALLTR